MYLNLIQLAESLGVEENVVEGWIRKEGLPCVRDAGRLLFDRAQVAEWAAERGLAAKAGFLAPVRSAPGAGIRLETLLRAGGVWRDVEPPRVLPVIEQVVTALPGATPEVRRMLAQRARAPGGITWAPVGGGLALPHLRSHVALGRDAGLVALVLVSCPVAEAEPPPDEIPITRLVFFIAPSPRVHLEMLARLSTALTKSDLHRLVLAGAPDEELFATVRALDVQTAAERPKGAGK